MNSQWYYCLYLLGLLSFGEFICIIFILLFYSCWTSAQNMLGKLSSTNHSPSLQKVLCVYSIIGFILWGFMDIIPHLFTINSLELSSALYRLGMCVLYICGTYTHRLCIHVCPFCHSPYSVEIGYFSEPGARPLASKPQWTCCPASSVLGLSVYATTLSSFYMSSGNLESVAHICVPNFFTSWAISLDSRFLT